MFKNKYEMISYNKEDVRLDNLSPVPELPSRVIDARRVFYTSSSASHVYSAVWDSVYAMPKADAEFNVNQWSFAITFSQDVYQQPLQQQLCVAVRKSRPASDAPADIKEWAAGVLSVEVRIENSYDMLSQSELHRAFLEQVKSRVILTQHPIHGNADGKEKKKQMVMMKDLLKTFPPEPKHPLKIGEYIATIRQQLHDIRNSPSMHTTSIILESMFAYIQEDSVQDINAALMLRILCGTHLDFGEILNAVKHEAGTRHTRSALALTKLLSYENEVSIAIATPKIVNALHTIALEACSGHGTVTRFTDVRDITTILFNIMRISSRDVRVNTRIYKVVFDIYKHTPSRLIQKCIINGFESIH